jgi:hypothetical protein
MRLRLRDPPAIAEADAFDDSLDVASVFHLPFRNSNRLGPAAVFLGRGTEQQGSGVASHPGSSSAGRAEHTRRGAEPGEHGRRRGGVQQADAGPGAHGSSGGAKASGRRVLFHLVAGALAGATAKTVEAPLDRVKIIFQVSKQRFSFPAAARQMVAIARAEGLTGLWKGNGACSL